MVDIQIITENSIPQYSSSGASGFDLAASEDVGEILPNQAILVPTGLFMAIPEGYEMQIRSRSGLAFNHNIIVLNSPGTIDSDYRGEIKVILFNIGTKNYSVSKGDRIAQGVICPVVQANFNKVIKLEDSIRGENGFGSTGVKS